jgi:thymidylate kinase
MHPDQTDAPRQPTRPFLISFSGIDGAGKTTQIESLSSNLQEQGFRVLRLSFWDDVAVWSKMRAGIGGAEEIGPTDTMAERPFSPKNNKHVRTWYLSAARAVMYTLDVARLQRLLRGRLARNADVIIFDRYIYDQIANIYSESFATRGYARILLKQAPTPNLAFIVDASPDAAFARKPEYPLEFMHRNRKNFLLLRELAPQLIIIPEGRAEDVRSDIYCHVSRSRLLDSGLTEEKTEVPGASAVALPQSSCRVRNDPTASL